VNPVALAFSSSGTLARGPFAIAVIVIYAVGLASQGLLTGPVLVRMGLWPFALLHAALLWVWFVVHAKRLRDAGHGIGAAVGVAIVNVLSITFLLMVVSFMTTPTAGPGSETGGSVLGTWIVLIFLIEILSGAPHLGWFGVILIILYLIALLPILLAVGFSIWTGTLRSAKATP